MSLLSYKHGKEILWPQTITSNRDNNTNLFDIEELTN